jgi:phospholipase A-2-activating protein
MEGDLVSTLSGHTSFVYALAVLPNGDMLSAGEDRTVRLWHDFDNTQTIVHPAISVWAVSTMPNGDIVSGTSDGVVRIFSHAEERWASADDLREYDAQVASQALPAQQMDSVKTSDPSVLTQPGRSCLLVEYIDAAHALLPGKKPGQTVMVKNPTTGTVEAHQVKPAR